MNTPYKLDFELCAESLQAVLAAQEGGAHRIELCTALSEGGLTPGHALLAASVRRSQLPVHVLLRPRAGDFVYTEAEFDLILDDLAHARALGAAGVVVGFLHPDANVDVERTRHLVARAAPLEVTFHRAFDCTPVLPLALEAVIATGCHRLLTSGGEPTVFAGASMLARLVAQAGDRIRVAAGGGLRLEHAEELARGTQATSFHGSMRTPRPTPYACLPGEHPGNSWHVDPADIRNIIQALTLGLAE